MDNQNFASNGGRFRDNDPRRFNRDASNTNTYDGDNREDRRSQDRGNAQHERHQDASGHPNYGEHYGQGAYGRAHYEPSQNRGWQEDQEFPNREQDYRGGEWNQRNREYDHLSHQPIGKQQYNRGIPSEMEQITNGPQPFERGGRSPFNQGSNVAMSGYGTLAQYGRGPHAGRGPKNYKRSDERLREDICERLTMHGEIDASEIEVSVTDGEVTLSGTVPDRQTRRLAEDIVEEVHGVKEVQMQLRVGPPTKTAQIGTTKNGHEAKARSVG